MLPAFGCWTGHARAALDRAAQGRFFVCFITVRHRYDERLLGNSRSFAAHRCELLRSRCVQVRMHYTYYRQTLLDRTVV